MDAFMGMIMPVGFNYAPRDWAQCDGQIVAISQNQSLFALLGTTYGGDGRTSFALPDLRGRTAVGDGTGPGLSARVIGQNGGQEYTAITVQSLPAHKHTINVKSGTGDQDDAKDAHLATGVPTEDVRGGAALGITKNGYSTTADAGSTLHAEAVNNTGGGLPISTMSPFLPLNYVIAVQGLYPSRN